MSYWNTEWMRTLLVGLCSIILLLSACRTATETTIGSDPDPASDSASATGSDNDDDATDTDADDRAADVPDEASTSSTVASTSTTEETERAIGCSAVVAGVDTFTMTAGGADHEVRVFIPSAFDPARTVPLVLNWHGLGGDGPGQAQFSGYEAVAETEGFIVVHPTGVPARGDTRNSWELPQFDSPVRDDVAFANALLDEMIASYCVDETRVYSTGMSNGGFFTSVLVCEMADRLAAAASVAGLTHDDGCNPSRAVPFIAFHGTADGVVPFDGTKSGSVLGGGGDFFKQIMPEEFGQFAADMGCDLEPTTSTYSSEVTAYDYVGCDDEVPLTFYEIADGGHTWPNTPLASRSGALGYATTQIDATADAWAFFEQHQLDG